jgi:hypothetical protein
MAKTAQKITEDEPITRQELETFGLFIRGRVQSRSKKFFEKSNVYRYTYILISKGQRITVQCWGDHTIYPLDRVVEIEVAIKCYLNKDGFIRYNLVIPNDIKVDEEVF